MRLKCLLCLAIVNVCTIFVYFNLSSESVKAITIASRRWVAGKPENSSTAEDVQFVSRPSKVEIVNSSELETPVPTPALYLTFDWNGGRVNNNVMALAAALTVASRMKPSRITLIQKPVLAATFPNPDYALIGIFEGYWDLNSVQKAGYPYVLDHDAPEVLQSEACVYQENKDQSACRRVHLPHAFAWMQGEEERLESQAEVRNTVRSLLQPAPWIKAIANLLLRKKFPQGRPSVSVHQRHHAWGNEKLHGSDFLCRGKLKNIASETGLPYRKAAKIWAPNDPARQHELLNITEISCALTFAELQAILKYWNHSLSPGEAFFLATDRERKDSFKEMVANGAVVISEEEVANHTTKFLAAIAARMKRHDCKVHLCATKKKLLSLAAVLVDTWAMSMGDFFVGGYYSTMSATACYWRGVEKMHDSSLCFLPSRLRAHLI